MQLKIQNDYLHGFFSIAEIFSRATGLATVVIDINGKPLSDCHNFNSFCRLMRADEGNDSNLLIVFYVQIMPDDFVMQLHRF